MALLATGTHLALLDFSEKVRAVPLKRRVHVGAGIWPLDHLPVAVQVELATEGAELVVAEVLTIRTSGDNSAPGKNVGRRASQRWRPSQASTRQITEGVKGRVRRGERGEEK